MDPGGCSLMHAWGKRQTDLCLDCDAYSGSWTIAIPSQLHSRSPGKPILKSHAWSEVLLWNTRYWQDDFCLLHSHTLPPCGQIPVVTTDSEDWLRGKSNLWQTTSELAEKFGLNLWPSTGRLRCTATWGKQTTGCQYQFWCTNVSGHRHEAQKFLQNRDENCQQVPL